MVQEEIDQQEEENMSEAKHYVVPVALKARR